MPTPTAERVCVLCKHWRIKYEDEWGEGGYLALYCMENHFNESGDTLKNAGEFRSSISRAQRCADYQRHDEPEPEPAGDIPLVPMLRPRRLDYSGIFQHVRGQTLVTLGDITLQTKLHNLRQATEATDGR